VSNSSMKATKSILPRRSVTETIRCPALGSTVTNRLVVAVAHVLVVLLAWVVLCHGPRLLSMCRTVSRLTQCMLGSWRAACSGSTMVQRWRPLGGVEQANAITRASALVSYWRGRPERSTSNIANSIPPCKYAARAHHTAVRSIPNTAMIWLSGMPRSRQEST
jgi:hypothetical protein